MNRTEVEISEKLFRTKYEQLNKQQKHVAHHLVTRTHIARNISKDVSENLTFGQRMADKVAAFGGSWTFISIFAAILILWILLNFIHPQQAQPVLRSVSVYPAESVLIHACRCSGTHNTHVSKPPGVQGSFKCRT